MLATRSFPSLSLLGMSPSRLSLNLCTSSLRYQPPAMRSIISNFPRAFQRFSSHPARTPLASITTNGTAGRKKVYKVRLNPTPSLQTILSIPSSSFCFSSSPLPSSSERRKKKEPNFRAPNNSKDSEQTDLSHPTEINHSQPNSDHSYSESVHPSDDTKSNGNPPNGNADTTMNSTYSGKATKTSKNNKTASKSADSTDYGGFGTLEWQRANSHLELGLKEFRRGIQMYVEGIRKRMKQFDWKGLRVSFLDKSHKHNTNSRGGRKTSEEGKLLATLAMLVGGAALAVAFATTVIWAAFLVLKTIFSLVFKAFFLLCAFFWMLPLFLPLIFVFAVPFMFFFGLLMAFFS